MVQIMERLRKKINMIENKKTQYLAGKNQSSSSSSKNWRKTIFDSLLFHGLRLESIKKAEIRLIRLSVLRSNRINVCCCLPFQLNPVKQLLLFF